MDNIKAHFQKEAKEFDEIIIKLIPYYHQMIDALIDAISFKKNESIRVLDLGCGTGTISKQISEQFPKSSIVCLDIASNMIEMAKLKLSKHKNTNFIVGDFSYTDFDGQFDVIVSSLALHHLENDADKKDFFAKIYSHLKDSGLFFNADVVLSSSEYLQKVNIDRWVEFINKSVSMEEIENKWLPKYYEEDRPAKLTHQLQWLEDIGFKLVDVIWKYYNFAVYGGMK